MAQTFVCYWTYILWIKIKYSLLGNEKNMEPRDWTRFNSHEWLRRVIQQYVGDSVHVPTLVKLELGDPLVGGLSSSMHKLILTWPDDASDQLPKTLVAKTTVPGFQRHFSSSLLGTAREALFYREMGSDDNVQIDLIPKVLYARGSMLTGEVLILMEDLSPVATAGGHLFGNQCWGPPRLPDNVQVDPVSALETIFLRVADIHAKYWRDEQLFSVPWLKMSDYIQGRNREQWEFAIERIKMKWQTVVKGIDQKTTSVKWSNKVRSEIDIVISNTNWDNFLRRFNISLPNTAFTLTHGDFHASNILWAWGNTSRPFYLVDWSEVGIFCPFTDLAQFVISHINVPMRREHEERIFKLYHDRLVQQGISPKTFPIESCWARYKSGGIERWTSMLIILATLGLPDAATQFFHDQVGAFIEDHSDQNTCLMTPYSML